MPTFIIEASADLPDRDGAYTLFSVEAVSRAEARAIAEERLLRNDVDWADTEGNAVDRTLPRKPYITSLQQED